MSQEIEYKKLYIFFICFTVLYQNNNGMIKLKEVYR